MRIFALTVARNEADRYLEPMLEAVRLAVYVHFVYDDDSTDDTGVLAAQHGAWVRRRPDEVPPFLQHEGQFRQAAWRAFEEECKPEDGDWILAIDADEIPVSSVDVGESLKRMIAEAESAVGVVLRIPEVFDFDAVGWPMVRVDGLWDGIAGPRLFRYRAGGVFADKAMGCGSEPTYVAAGSLYRPTPRSPSVSSEVFLMHLGYADMADRDTKYARYSGLADHGHAGAHVESIRAEPVLKHWEGPGLPVPEWRAAS